MDAQKELVGASTSVLILSVLAGEASYGYEIIKRINAVADGAFVWQEGTVYPVLHKLERNGLVRTQWQEADSGRRRKYYYLTATGRKALSTQRDTWTVFYRMVGQLTGEAHA